MEGGARCFMGGRGGCLLLGGEGCFDSAGGLREMLYVEGGKVKKGTLC